MGPSGLKQRKEFINDNNLSSSCLKTGHQSRSCKSKKPCFYCKRTDHHQSICNEDDQTNQNWRKGASKGENVSKGGGSAQKGESSNSVLHAMEYSNKVMLMTALTKATNSATGRSITCRVILDTACDTTFIKESSARKLGLDMETLPIGFGNQKTRVKTKGVKFILGGVEVKAKTAESICRPLKGKGFNKKEMGGSLI